MSLRNPIKKLKKKDKILFTQIQNKLLDILENSEHLYNIIMYLFL